MDKRLAIAWLIVASIVYACSPRSHASERRAPRTSEQPMSHGIDARVDVTTQPTVTFVLELTNRTGKLTELQFPSAQTHDFAVLNAKGDTVWRWSRERMFTQVMRTEALAKNAQLTFTEQWKDAAPGAYTLVATTTSLSHPVSEQIGFTVR